MTEGTGKSRCPNCGKPTVAQFRPFCSRRCGDLDLHRWLSGRYRVETEETPESSSDEAGEMDEI